MELGLADGGSVVIALARTAAGPVELAYDDVGLGTPVLFLHAFPLARRMWSRQLGPLVDHARGIALDSRGFGDSTIDAPHSIEQYADDAAALLDALEVPRAVVCGASMGGAVALSLWRRHRARVRALVLVSTRPGLDSDDARATRHELIALARSKGSAAIADRMLPGLIGSTTREKTPEVADHIHMMMEAAPPTAMIGAMQAMLGRPDSTPLLSTIDVPTLLIAGDEDVGTPVGEARAMHDVIGPSTLQVIAGAGHLSPVERPAAFNHVLGEFLAMLACD